LVLEDVAIAEKYDEVKKQFFIELTWRTKTLIRIFHYDYGGTNTT
jgi:hypothetical protein